MAGKIVVSEILSDTSSSNTVKIGSGMTLDLNSQGAVTMPTGSVLQVLQSEHSAAGSTTSSSYQDIPLSITITPGSTSNKILVLSNVWIGVADTGNYGAMVQLLRGSTQICLGDGSGSRPRVAGVGYSLTHNQDIWLVTTSYLDSPITTSATTYKLQLRSGWNGNTVYVNRPGYTGDNAGGGRTTSTITVMEIAG